MILHTIKHLYSVKQASEAHHSVSPRRCRSTHLRQHLLQEPGLHRMHETRHTHHRASAEILREPLRVAGGTHEHHAQVWIVLDAGEQQRQQQVRVHVSLVHLVHHHVTDATQTGVGL